LEIKHPRQENARLNYIEQKIDQALMVSIPIQVYFQPTFNSKSIVERGYQIITAASPPPLNVKSFKKWQVTSHNLPHKSAENFY
jgi:hypothetical protein